MTTRVFTVKYLFLALLISGCELRVGDKPRVCTAEQLTMMSKYTEQCERGFEKSFCFIKAQEAYCTDTTFVKDEKK
jgi:hypothetical protein